MNAYKQASAISLALILIISLMVGSVPAVDQDSIEPLPETVESPNGMLI